MAGMLPHVDMHLGNGRAMNFKIGKRCNPQTPTCRGQPIHIVVIAGAIVVASQAATQENNHSAR